MSDAGLRRTSSEEYEKALTKFGPRVPHPNPIDVGEQARACGNCGATNVVFDLPGGFYGHTRVKVWCRACGNSVLLPGWDYGEGMLAGTGWRSVCGEAEAGAA